MRKIFIILVGVLLIASTAHALEWTEAITAEYAARNIGRSTATDSSVLFKVWSKDGSLPFAGVGVSSSTSIIIYKNFAQGTQVGYTLQTNLAALDTVGEIVDYINSNFASDSSVGLYASVGNDAYRAMATTTLVPANIIACGTAQDNTTAQVLKQTNDRITCGVEAKDRVSNRIKEFNVQLGVFPTSGGITLRIMDGATQVWRKYVSTGSWNGTGLANSSNTVKLDDSKGISSSIGNGLVVEAVADTQQPINSAAELAGTNISIIYDQLKQ